MGVFARVFPFGTTVFLILTGLCEVPVTGMRNIAFPEKLLLSARQHFRCAKDRSSPRCPFPRWKKWEISHSRRSSCCLQDSKSFSPLFSPSQKEMRNIPFPEKSSGPARPRFCSAKDRISLRCSLPRRKKREISHSRRNPWDLQGPAFSLPVLFSPAAFSPFITFPAGRGVPWFFC